MKYTLPTAFAVLLLATILVATPGCTPAPTPTDPVAAHAAEVTKIAGAINLGTSSAVSIGLVAIPDPNEAKTVADLAAGIIDNNVMPILNGDNDGLINGIGQIMSLSAFNDPKLAKVKMILEVAMPLLTNYLPPDLTSNAVNKVNPDVKAYLIAFFSGVRTGITNYEGGVKAMPAERDFVDFTDLRKKLQAK